jgi:hypothetical protein
MANFIVSYDLNGPTPSHKQVDDLFSRLGATRGRVLETLWWVDYSGTAEQLRNHLQTILQRDDSVLVCKCTSAAWSNLLVDGLADAWNKAA